MDLDSRFFFAARFRELAERFERPVATSRQAAAAEQTNLRTIGGQLFVAAVKRGYLSALRGAVDLVTKYEDPPASAPHTEVSWSWVPANLLCEVAGALSEIEVFNDNGKLKALRALPPRGLIPDAFPEMQQVSVYLQERYIGSEIPRDEIEAMLEDETRRRYASACRILAELLESQASRAQRADRTPISPNDERDQYLYRQRCAGESLKTLKTKLAANSRGWGAIETLGGIKAAIARFCKRTEKPLPPQRRPGRPRKK